MIRRYLLSKLSRVLWTWFNQPRVAPLFMNKKGFVEEAIVTDSVNTMTNDTLRANGTIAGNSPQSSRPSVVKKITILNGI